MSYFLKRKSYFFTRKYYDVKRKYYDIKYVSLVFSKGSNKVPDGVLYIRHMKGGEEQEQPPSFSRE